MPLNAKEIIIREFVHLKVVGDIFEHTVNILFPGLTFTLTVPCNISTDIHYVISPSQNSN